MKEPHEPCDCELWHKWKEHIRCMGDGESGVCYNIDVYIY